MYKPPKYGEGKRYSALWTKKKSWGLTAMDFSLIWQTIITFLFGVLALRVAGRKSLAQMTVAETVVMIAVGTILIEPLVGKDLWKTFGAVSIIITTLYILEYIQLKWPFLEKVFTGKAVMVIEEGKIKMDNLRKLRMTVEQLEIHLRRASITRIEEVRHATIEPNGQLGFVLEESAQPITKGDYMRLMERIKILELLLRGKDNNNHFSDISSRGFEQSDKDLFGEVKAEEKS